jgi:hypothetical protein
MPKTKDDFKTNYTKELETINSMLKATNIVPGDMVRVTRYEGLLPVCGYYAGTTECMSVIEFDKNKGQYKIGDGGLEIVISPCLHKLQHHSITKPGILHDVVLVRDIKSLEKLIPEKKLG